MSGHLLPDIFERFEIATFGDSGRLYDSCGYRRLLLAVAAEPGLTYRTGLGGPGTQSFSFANCKAKPSTVIVQRGPEMTRGKVQLGIGASMKLASSCSCLAGAPGNSVVARGCSV